jgi:Domain of unknown function (DUF1963)
MKSIRGFTGHTLSRVSGQIESAAKKSIRLLSEERSSDATNRLGGKPNLPKGFNWPTWREQPLAFVAQLDLATLPQLPELPLPRTGSLSFFYEGGENAWGFSPDHAGSSVVLYMQEPLSSFPLRSLPEDLEDHLRFTGVTLLPQPLDLSMPGLQDQALEDLAMSTEEREAYYNSRQASKNPQRAAFTVSAATPTACRAIRSWKRIWFRKVFIAVTRADIRPARREGSTRAQRTGSCCCRLIRTTKRR